MLQGSDACLETEGRCRSACRLCHDRRGHVGDFHRFGLVRVMVRVCACRMRACCVGCVGMRAMHACMIRCAHAAEDTGGQAGRKEGGRRTAARLWSGSGAMGKVGRASAAGVAAGAAVTAAEMQNGARKSKTHNCLEQQVGHTLNKVIKLSRDFHGFQISRPCACQHR